MSTAATDGPTRDIDTHRFCGRPEYVICLLRTYVRSLVQVEFFRIPNKLINTL